jgi:transposase-like protein
MKEFVCSLCGSAFQRELHLRAHRGTKRCSLNVIKKGTRVIKRPAALLAKKPAGIANKGNVRRTITRSISSFILYLKSNAVVSIPRAYIRINCTPGTKV